MSEQRRPVYDLVRQIALRGAKSSSWVVLIRPDTGDRADLMDLIEEVQVQLNCHARTLNAAGLDVAQLRQALQDPSDDIVVLEGLEFWQDESMQALDENRRALARPGTVLCWLPLNGLARLFARAPNLRSWIGGGVFESAQDPGVTTASERNERLRELSEHYGMDGAQVINLAETHCLPPEPEFVEWLILLGRPDVAP